MCKEGKDVPLTHVKQDITSCELLLANDTAKKKLQAIHLFGNYSSHLIKIKTFNKLTLLHLIE